MQEKARETPSTPQQTRSRFGGCLNTSSSVKKAASENFLDSIESKHENASSNSLLLGGKSKFNTPGRSEDNILAAYSNSHILSTGVGTGTPGRIKKFCKRVRRRSVEIFNIKKEEREEHINKRTDHLSSVSSASHQDVRGIKSMFGGSTRRKVKGGGGGLLKKSVSTPSLSTTRRKSSTSDDSGSGDGGDFSKRKLSFNSDINVSRATQNDSDVTSFESGFVNNAFLDNVSTDANDVAVECSGAVLAAKTPVIRKALCPSSLRTPRHDVMAAKEKRSGLLQSIENTPKIMKPTKGHRTVPPGGNNDSSAQQSVATPSTTTASTKLKVKKGLRVSGQFKRFTSFSKRVSGGGSGGAQIENTVVHQKTSRDNGDGGEDKENICKVTGL